MRAQLRHLLIHMPDSVVALGESHVLPVQHVGRHDVAGFRVDRCHLADLRPFEPARAWFPRHWARRAVSNFGGIAIPSCLGPLLQEIGAGGPTDALRNRSTVPHDDRGKD